MNVLILVLSAAIIPWQAAAPAAKVPATPAGQALTGFVESFNAGGETRRKWVETRTTLQEGPRANVLKTDAQFLTQHGPITVVRIAKASPASIAAVVRHAKTGVHGFLTVDVEPAAPHKVVNLNMRAATPEEIKGGARP